jgi:hypothetical protein
MRNASKYRSIPMQIYDLIVHKIIINTHPADYYEFGFFRPGKSWDEKSRYIGLKGSKYYPFENNPLKYNVLFTDKYVEKLLCKGAGLPTTDMLATVGIDRDITTQQQLNQLLSTISKDVVIKPISGAGGKKIIIVSRAGDNIFINKKPSSIEDIWKHINTDIKRGFLIEEKQVNPPRLAKLFPTCLNTYRVVTIKTDDGKWHLGQVTLKLGAGNNVVDNYGAGGVEVYFDENGRSVRAASKKDGLLTRHPDTNANLIGIELEGYQEVIDLGLRASKVFGFMGTFGWDIAFTTKGPQVIEGNLFWGTDYLGLTRGMVSDEIAKGLKPRNMFSKWDKKYMYPHIGRKRRWLW